MNQNDAYSLDEALARVDDDRDLFLTMAELFIDQGPKDLAEVRSAIAAQDPIALARSAHRIKGAIVQFCAPAAFEATRELEELGKTGNLLAAVEACANMEAELLRLLTALSHTIEKGFST